MNEARIVPSPGQRITLMMKKMSPKGSLVAGILSCHS